MFSKIRNFAAAVLLALPLCGFFSADVRAPAVDPKVEQVLFRGGHGPLQAAPAVPDWDVVKVGNGGFVKGGAIAPTGAKVVTTDTFGCYIWSSTKNQWMQLLKTTVMPSGSGSLAGGPGENKGCDFMGIDASGATVWFFFQGNLYKYDVATGKASATGFPTQPTLLSLANQAGQAWGPYIAVDPNNSNVVYVSTPSNGLYLTLDGGTTFNPVTAVAAGLPINVNNTAASPKAATSTTSLTIGTGSKTFTTSATLGYSAGFYVQVWQTSNPMNQMAGLVTSNSGTSLTINVTNTQGSGSGITDWSIATGINGSNGQGPSGGHRVVFNNAGAHNCGAGSNQTCEIFIHTYNINIWKSTDGGSTLTPVTSTNRPKGVRKMWADGAGVLWTVDDDYPGSNTNADKYDTTTWTAHINTGAGLVWYDSGDYDPSNCSTKSTCRVVFVSGADGSGALTNNGGSTYNLFGGSGNRSYVSSGDVDWILTYWNANPNIFFGANTVMYDPSSPGKLWWMAEGVYSLTPPTSGAAITFTQQTRGIEEFIAVRAIMPTADAVTFTMWDFPCIYTSNWSSYPTAISCLPGSAQTQLMRGYSIDYAWNAPNTQAMLAMDGTFGNHTTTTNYSGVTTTGGQTAAAWTRFPTRAPITTGGTGNAGGCIALSDANHIMYIPVGSSSVPKYTTDGGTTWNDMTVSGGIPTTSWGPLVSYATFSRSCESDKGNGDLYAYNLNVNNGGSDGIYKFANGSGAGTLQSNPLFAATNNNFNEQMKSVGITGHLSFTPGLQGGSHPNSTALLYYTTNGWTSKGTVTGFKEVLTVAYGATWPGKAYPGMYVAGWFTGTELVNGVSTSVTSMYGVHMCKEFNTSTGGCNGGWALLGYCDSECTLRSQLFPLGLIGYPADMAADPVTPGKVVIWTSGGAGWIQAQ